jgi:retron-type reverse transcriptase
MTVHDWADWLRDNQLGIPVVGDRLVQPMILPRLEPLLDPAFSPSSYGFRPNRYAAAGNISVHSRAAGQRVRESGTRFLEEKLQLNGFGASCAAIA